MKENQNQVLYDNYCIIYVNYIFTISSYLVVLALFTIQMALSVIFNVMFHSVVFSFFELDCFFCVHEIKFVE